MTLTFVRSGLKYFSESLAHSTYGSTKRRRMPFRDLLRGLTLMLSLKSVPFEKVRKILTLLSPPGTDCLLILQIDMPL